VAILLYHIAIYYQYLTRNSNRWFNINHNIGDNPMSKTTMIVLRAAGPCEIKLGWLTKVYSGFKKLAPELEKRLRPKLKKGQCILWILNYYLEDDDPDKECLPLPSVSCEIFIVDKGGERSKPFGFTCFTWGPVLCHNSLESIGGEAELVEAAAQSLLQ